MSESATRPIIVAGAGVIGTSTALMLARSGEDVILVDRLDPGAGTSSGNAGVLSLSSIMPVSMPGFHKKIPGMLMDPLAPLWLRWRYLPRFLPWAFAFLRAAKDWKHQAAALNSIVQDSIGFHETLIDECKLDHLLVKRGWLELYETDKALQGAQSKRDTLDVHNVRYAMVNPLEIHDLEPELADKFVGGMHVLDTMSVRSPQALVEGYARRFVELGGDIRKTDIKDIRKQDDHFVMDTADGQIEGARIVLALGAFSSTFGKAFGLKVPLDTERGYHAMLDFEGEGLNRPVFFVNRGFVMAPQEGGIRMTSGAEIGGTDAPPDYSIPERILPLAKEVLPTLNTDPKSLWLGYRPSTPDSLPIIGPSPVDDRVVFAFGHGHIGLTLGAVTGHIASQLVMGQALNRDISAFDPGREI